LPSLKTESIAGHLSRERDEFALPNEADAPNPVPLILLHFEEDYDDENEDDLVAALPRYEILCSRQWADLRAARRESVEKQPTDRRLKTCYLEDRH
jgi:hypothetical protein